MQFNQNRIFNYYIHSFTKLSRGVGLVILSKNSTEIFTILYIDLEDFENERFETFDHFDDVSHHHQHHDEYIVKPNADGNILNDFASSDHLPPTRPPRPERPNRHVFSRPPHPTYDPFHDPPSFGFNHIGPGYHDPGPPPPPKFLGPTGIHSPQLPPSSTKDQHQVTNASMNYIFYCGLFSILFKE